jgi:hypothetical protein
VLAQLGESLGAADRHPTRPEFRDIVKKLGDRFPTRRLVNTQVLGDAEIAQATKDVVQAVLRPGEG